MHGNFIQKTTEAVSTSRLQTTFAFKRRLPVASVNEAFVQRLRHPTGVACAAIFPTGAIDLRHFKDEQIGSMLEALLVGSE